MTLNVTIVVPTHNRAALLRRSLASIFGIALPAGVKADLLVINNRCTDDTSDVVRDLARRAPLPVREVAEDRTGLGYARNRGLKEASGDHVVFFDDDVEVDPDWLAAYGGALEEHGADCVVGPVHPLFEKVPLPGYLTPIVLESITSPYSRRGDAPCVLPAETAYEIPGCNFGVRKEAALRVGGFDTRLDRRGKGLLAGGDYEFGLKLVAAGARIVYHPGCAIRHVITREKTSKQYLRRRWTADGLTMHIFDKQRGVRFTCTRRARNLLGMARMTVAYLLLRAARKDDVAFEKELLLRRVVSYVRGPHAEKEDPECT